MGENEKTDQPPADDSKGEQETSRGRSENSAVPFVIDVKAATVVCCIVTQSMSPTSVERRAVLRLRAIGRCQLAYQGTNNNKSYGSFEVLKAAGYFREDETLDAIIGGYTVDWSVFNPGPPPGLLCDWILINHFTVVAYPRAERSLGLRTFAITEDQVVRVYNPVGGNKPDAVNGWDRAP